jgi:hypothetical protein
MLKAYYKIRGFFVRWRQARGFLTEAEKAVIADIENARGVLAQGRNEEILFFPEAIQERERRGAALAEKARRGE